MKQTFEMRISMHRATLDQRLQNLGTDLDAVFSIQWESWGTYTLHAF